MLVRSATRALAVCLAASFSTLCGGSPTSPDEAVVAENAERPLVPVDPMEVIESSTSRGVFNGGAGSTAGIGRGGSETGVGVPHGGDGAEGAGAESLPVGPKVLTCPVASVHIQPGMEPNEVVREHPAGTTYCFERGLHRLTEPVDVRDGDIFAGEVGAVLSGAKLLSDWGVHRAGVWKAQVPGGIVAHVNGDRASCDCAALSDDGHDRSEYVFIDDEILRWAADVNQLADGTFHIDYANATVYVGRDPAGTKVEVAYAVRAFGGNAVNVTVKNLVLEKFATPAGNDGVVHAKAPGSSGWVIEDCEIRLNHGRGISAGTMTADGPGATVQRNHIHHNGWLGIGGNNTRGVVAHNEVSFNNMLGFPVGWGGGGMKFGATSAGRWKFNRVHDNYGWGIWIDTGSGVTGTNILGHNQLWNNSHGGIQYEISSNAEIHHNVIRNNGHGKRTWPPGRGAGILIVASGYVNVHHNVVVGNFNGISGISSSRGDLGGLVVRFNEVSLAGPQLTGVWGSRPGGAPRPVWDDNTYRVCSPGAAHWHGAQGTQSFPEWQSLGNDISPVASLEVLACE